MRYREDFFLKISVSANIFAGYVVISIEECPFTAVCCLVTWCWEWEGSYGSKKGGGRGDLHALVAGLASKQEAYGSFNIYAFVH